MAWPDYCLLSQLMLIAATLWRALDSVNPSVLLQVTVELLLAASNAGTGGNGSVLSFNGFALIALVLGTSITVAWGAYGKNSEYGLSLKRTGPLGAVKVRQFLGPTWLRLTQPVS